MAEPDPDTDENSYSPRRALLGLAIVLLIVMVCLYLFYTLRDMAQSQDCVMQGRTNCAPIESPTTGS